MKRFSMSGASSAALAAALLLCASASAQTLQQAGPWATGHAPSYVNGSGQPFVTDGGPAAGGVNNPLQEGLYVAPQPAGGGNPPFVASGTGPLGANWCDYDGPISSTGYHYLCLSPNVAGGAAIIYGAVGATPGPLAFYINGTKYTFPFVTTGVVGPGTSIVGHLATWNNTAGTLLADSGSWPPVTSVFNFLSTAQITDVTTRACTLDVAAAINAGISTTAGAFRFPAGTYCVSTPFIINTNQTFRGDNRGATVVKVLGSTATVLLKTFNFNSLLNSNTPVGPNHFEIDDMEFNGNSNTVVGGGTGTGTGVTGATDNIDIYGYNFVLRNVSTYNASNEGILSQWALNGTVPVAASADGGSMEAHTYNLQAFGNADYGIIWQGPTDSILTDTLVMINGGGGIELQSGLAFTGGSVLNTLHSYGNCTGPGINIVGVSLSPITVSGSNVQSETNGSVHCAGAGSNSQGVTANQYSAVYLDGVLAFGNAQRGVFVAGTNGRITGLVSSANGTDGLGVGNTATNNVFSGIVAGFNTGYGINASGLGNIFSGVDAGSNTLGNTFPAPTASSCGSAPAPSITVGSTDASGSVVIGGGSITTCTITFTKTYAVAPICTLTAGGNYSPYFPAGQPVAGGMNFLTAADMHGTVVSWSCPNVGTSG